jgi:hypothetical protein
VVDEDEEKARIISTAGVDAEDANAVGRGKSLIDG